MPPRCNSSRRLASNWTSMTCDKAPTSSSWMNLVIERWFSELTEKWLRRGSHRSVKDLACSITNRVNTWNENPRPFVWHKTADEIIESLARYCQRISETSH